MKIMLHRQDEAYVLTYFHLPCTLVNFVVHSYIISVELILRLLPTTIFYLNNINPTSYNNQWHHHLSTVRLLQRTIRY